MNINKIEVEMKEILPEINKMDTKSQEHLSIWLKGYVERCRFEKMQQKKVRKEQ